METAVLENQMFCLKQTKEETEADLGLLRVQTWEEIRDSIPRLEGEEERWLIPHDEFFYRDFISCLWF